MASRLRVLGAIVAGVLAGAATSSVALAAPTSTALDSVRAERGGTELRGAAILAHPVGRLALDYAELVHAGRMDEAMALATENEREKTLAQSPRQRERSEQFRRKVLPRPALFTFAIEHGGVLSIRGATAFLEVVTSSRHEDPDGSVTSSSTTLALPFALENGEWRVAG